MTPRPWPVHTPRRLRRLPHRQSQRNRLRDSRRNPQPSFACRSVFSCFENGDAAAVRLTGVRDSSIQAPSWSTSHAAGIVSDQIPWFATRRPPKTAIDLHCRPDRRPDGPWLVDPARSASAAPAIVRWGAPVWNCLDRPPHWKQISWREGGCSTGQIECVLLLAVPELVRFLRMQSGAGRVSLL